MKQTSRLPGPSLKGSVQLAELSHFDLQLQVCSGMSAARSKGRLLCACLILFPICLLNHNANRSLQLRYESTKFFFVLCYLLFSCSVLNFLVPIGFYSSLLPDSELCQCFSMSHACTECAIEHWICWDASQMTACQVRRKHKNDCSCSIGFNLETW